MKKSQYSKLYLATINDMISLQQVGEWTRVLATPKKELETIVFKWQRGHSFLPDGLLFGRVRKRKVHGNF